MRKDMDRRERNKIFSDYGKVVFLNCFMNSDKYALQNISYLKSDFNIGDTDSYIKNLLKNKYLFKKGRNTVISQKGLKFLKHKKDYLDFFEMAIPYVDIFDYVKCRKRQQKSKSFEDVMLKLLNEKAMEYQKACDEIAVINLNYEIGKIYQQKQDENKALYHYLTALFYNVSGLEYYESFVDYMDGRLDFEELKKTYNGICIDVSLKKSIAELKACYIEDMAEIVYDKNPVNMTLCRCEDFKKLIADILAGKFDENKWQTYFDKMFALTLRLASLKKS